MCDVRKLAVRLVLSGIAAGYARRNPYPGKRPDCDPDPVQEEKARNPRPPRDQRHPSRAHRSAPPRKPTRIATRYSAAAAICASAAASTSSRNNEISWATAFNYYLNPKLAVVGDARGSFGNAHALTNNEYGVYKPQINEYIFMGGVSYRFSCQGKICPQRPGPRRRTGWGIFSGGSKGIPGSYLGLWNDGLRPAFSLGVSADYNVYPNFAVRFTPTWVGTNFVGPTGSTIQNNLGFNIGVVYRFGHQ